MHKKRIYRFLASHFAMSNRCLCHLFGRLEQISGVRQKICMQIEWRRRSSGVAFDCYLFMLMNIGSSSPFRHGVLMLQRWLLISNFLCSILRCERIAFFLYKTDTQKQGDNLDEFKHQAFVTIKIASHLCDGTRCGNRFASNWAHCCHCLFVMSCDFTHYRFFLQVKRFLCAALPSHLTFVFGWFAIVSLGPGALFTFGQKD